MAILPNNFSNTMLMRKVMLLALILFTTMLVSAMNFNETISPDYDVGDQMSQLIVVNDVVSQQALEIEPIKLSHLEGTHLKFSVLDQYYVSERSRAVMCINALDADVNALINSNRELIAYEANTLTLYRMEVLATGDCSPVNIA